MTRYWTAISVTFTLGCGPPGARDDGSRSSSDTPESASLVCGPDEPQWPGADLSEAFGPGGWGRPGTAFFSDGAWAVLHIEAEELARAGEVRVTLPAESAVLWKTAAEVMETCRHDGVSGTILARGELAPCADSGAEDCLVGRVTFEPSMLLLNSGACFDDVQLVAEFEAVE